MTRKQRLEKALKEGKAKIVAAASVTVKDTTLDDLLLPYQRAVLAEAIAAPRGTPVGMPAPTGGLCWMAEARRCICARCAKYDGCPNAAPLDDDNIRGYEWICADCRDDRRHLGHTLEAR